MIFCVERLFMVMLYILMVGIGKFFGLVYVLKLVNLMVYSGEIYVLLGENGVGKFMLMKVLFGIYELIKGIIIINNISYNKLDYKLVV